MKRTAIVFITLAVSLSFLLVSCSSGPQQQQQQHQRTATEPDWVLQRQDYPPENMFQGIGTARVNNNSMSRTMAEARARVSLAQQMSSVVRNMIIDFTGASESEPDIVQYMENVSRLLAEAHLQGTHPTIRSYNVGPNTFEGWAVMTFARADANRVMANAANQAVAALAPHRQEALRGLRDMDRAFDQHFERRDPTNIVRE